ncbi:MAG: ISNCY family transposase, partial [Verrucomicrobiaceae bacterium]|nr:ISNCY family transposase [Verrucomicrobiaceae bacterium]
KRSLKIVGRTSTKVNNPGNTKEKGGDLHGGSDMRLAFPQERLDCLPIGQVKLNLNCRDELIPILRALQHLYQDDACRSEVLRLVGKDVNHGASRKRGRRGLSYWEIIVLAAARLGCNLDYDKLQDLAENHRSLRQIMGIGDWQEEVDFDWRRIEDNLTKLRAETIKKIYALVVQAGHALKPKAIAAVRGDTFVVETTIHYPTESTLIGDGLRKVLPLAAKLAAENGLEGWRQHEHLLRKAKKIVHGIGRVSRAKGRGADRLKPGYQKLLALAEEVLTRARRLLGALAFVMPETGLTLEKLRQAAPPAQQENLLFHYVSLTAKVCGNARRRVLEGETLSNDEKIFSIFEPHTELIKRGKQPVPIQYGHNVLVIEDAVGFVVEHRVVEDAVLDQDLVVPVMRQVQDRFGGKIKSASFDRAFHTPENQRDLAEIVRTPCIACKGEEKGRKQHKEGTVAFRKARQNHPGVESGIGALQAGNGLKRCRDKGKRGFERYVALGVLGRNLQTLGKLLLAQDAADCQAAKSKRKREAG